MSYGRRLLGIPKVEIWESFLFEWGWGLRTAELQLTKPLIRSSIVEPQKDC